MLVNPAILLDVIFWMLGYRILVDMLGNTLETKPEFELAAYDFDVAKTRTKTKLIHNDPIRIPISFIDGHITTDFLFSSSGLVLQHVLHSFT